MQYDNVREEWNHENERKRATSIVLRLSHNANGCKIGINTRIIGIINP